MEDAHNLGTMSLDQLLGAFPHFLDWNITSSRDRAFDPTHPNTQRLTAWYQLHFKADRSSTDEDREALERNWRGRGSSQLLDSLHDLAYPPPAPEQIDPKERLSRLSVRQLSTPGIWLSRARDRGRLDPHDEHTKKLAIWCTLRKPVAEDLRTELSDWFRCPELADQLLALAFEPEKFDNHPASKPTFAQWAPPVGFVAETAEDFDPPAKEEDGAPTNRRKRRPGPRGPKPARAAEPPMITIKPGLSWRERNVHVENALLCVVARFHRLGHRPTAVEAAERIIGVERKVVLAVLHRLAGEKRVVKRTVGRTKKTGQPIQRFEPVEGFEGVYVAGEIWSVCRIAANPRYNRLGIDRGTLRHRIYVNGWSVRDACMTPTGSRSRILG